MRLHGKIVLVTGGNSGIGRGTAQNRTDLRIGWSSPDVPWSVALYGNNLFDKRYVTGISNISATTLGTPFASISAPRFWGVEVAAHF